MATSVTVEEIHNFASRGFADRKIRKDICEFYGVKVGYSADGKIIEHYYPYSSGGYKLRKLPKEFSWVGPKGGMGLFGQQLFQGGGKRLVITEGEIDALSVAQAIYDKYKKHYPVISIPSSTGVKELIPHRDWIRAFDEVVIAFDADEPGEKATQAAIKIIGIDKVKLWKPPCKDANEVLLKHGPDILNQCIWDAAAFIPSGIISKEALWEALEKYNDVVSVPYPPCLAGLNTKLKGMRMNEITLFISGSGAGKSSLFREIMLHVLETTDASIGIISLEESPQETARKLAGMALSKNPSKDEIPLSELKVGFDKVFGNNKAILLDHQGNIDEEGMLSKLEYMALSGCSYIFVDHITLFTAEASDAKSNGNEATDRIMAALLRFVKKHNVWLGLISHLRKSGLGGKSFEQGRMPNLDDAKGSGSLKQICFDIVAFSRDLSAESEDVRNTIEMSVLKSRYSGLTGPVSGAKYDYNSGRLHAAEESFEVI